MYAKEIIDNKEWYDMTLYILNDVNINEMRHDNGFKHLYDKMIRGEKNGIQMISFQSSYTYSSDDTILMNLINSIPDFDEIPKFEERTFIDIVQNSFFKDRLSLGIIALTLGFVFASIYYGSVAFGIDLSRLTFYVCLVFLGITSVISVFRLSNIYLNQGNKDDNNRISNSLLDKIQRRLENEIDSFSVEDAKKERSFNEIHNILITDIKRFSKEIASLKARANTNLTIAMLTTFITIVFLIYFIVDASNIYTEFKTEIYKDFTIETTYSFLVYLVPRISLAIIIELFSYYFLSMYRASLSEIKYYQNELTEIEQKNIALNMALLSNDIDTKSIVEQLLKTDKNRILKKDETTTEIEMQKIGANHFKYFDSLVTKIMIAIKGEKESDDAKKEN